MELGKLTKRLRLIHFWFVLTGIYSVNYVLSTEIEPSSLSNLTLEELMNIEITSVSKRPEKLSQAAAAVYVITQEDIRRSGATNIPEALRMVPGLQMARIDANKWAISTRGFTWMFANKLLVLIDGRTVYTPLFSGVFWDAQDTLLEDVDRIEVIRGPGAALWGANAMNGIINIITKHAKDTQGGLLTLSAGTEENAVGGVRYGGKVGDNTFYRVYSKYLNHDDFVNVAGEDMNDRWDMIRSGFRMDSKLSSSDELMVQGDIYGSEIGTTYSVPVFQEPYAKELDFDESNAGAFLLSRWNRVLSDTSDMSLRLYYDWTNREIDIGGQDRDTFDLDFQHHFQWAGKHKFIWGAGYRFTTDSFDDTLTVSLDPASRSDHLFSAFVQDEIALWEDYLKLIIGSKFEHNDYSGFEIQPNARLVWTPHPRHTIWTAVSRAVRTPSRGDHDVRLIPEIYPPDNPIHPSPYPVFSILEGSDDFTSEEMLAYELGYRLQATDWLSLDLAGFYNVYDRLRTSEFGLLTIEDEPPPRHFFVPTFLDNKMDGETYGFELAATVQPSPGWNVQAVYSFLSMQFHPDSDSMDLNFESLETDIPHQFMIRSFLDVTPHVEWDVRLRYVDKYNQISGYTAVDTRLGWKPTKSFELSIGANNLFDDRHLESGSPVTIDILPSEVERNVYIKAVWKF